MLWQKLWQKSGQTGGQKLVQQSSSFQIPFSLRRRPGTGIPRQAFAPATMGQGQSKAERVPSLYNHRHECGKWPRCRPLRLRHRSSASQGSRSCPPEAPRSQGAQRREPPLNAPARSRPSVVQAGAGKRCLRILLPAAGEMVYLQTTPERQQRKTKPGLAAGTASAQAH